MRKSGNAVFVDSWTIGEILLMLLYALEYIGVVSTSVLYGFEVAFAVLKNVVSVAEMSK